ncbi:uncharacterized protein LOC108048152 [Drosophila rhopaloa]|uniref:Uncharacterized protein LOC108048152 n=1 Tax=Drosophila rhopaloa TaxID=1041015 RepID=A0A6P4FF24_DRORH|nr:uncharacterized protein LOC108048152 [Drosophila rhopaloa]
MDKADKSSKLADNFLYMLEFVVDDLLITRQNLCAPEEYPTCTEITFRSIFLNICDRENGTCVSPCSPKTGKCALFTLDTPITDEDVMNIHVYKKRSEGCKFLLGLTELKMKPIFDRVKKEFDSVNINWEENVMTHVSRLPRIRGPCKKINTCDCFEKHKTRLEAWCPTSEITKRMLPLFNLCKMQTGNIVLILRLVCNGPSVVSSFAVTPKCKNPCCTSCCPCPETWPAPCSSPIDPCDPCKSVKSKKT